MRVNEQPVAVMPKNAMSFRCTLRSYIFSRIPRNVNRKVYNDRKNVSATASLQTRQFRRNVISADALLPHCRQVALSEERGMGEGEGRRGDNGDG